MTITSHSVPSTAHGAASKSARIAGLIVTALVVALLLFDSVIHLMNTSQVRDAMADLGFDPSLNRVIGAVLLVSLVLYVVPVTSILGAVLLTGYLGGAVASNMLTEQPIVSTTLFPIYVGIFVWGALWLRDTGVRAIMPLRRA
ncbi:DoxX family protein [Rhodococcus coprophilus]|uniref:DoxX family protein n=1 Tax=Rhodococcus coprophilus TaxID=38310 RepID=A0A2X4U055_9NOCA|nr:DoxX family protein [Rhodococcus coprophilus]MBM7458661.1 hypothetical protein [Rhodococcus coprophilus]SQI33147.1 Uncharacterised protein [Rhodococcus coprophilus]